MPYRVWGPVFGLIFMDGGDDGVSENGSLEVPKKPVSNKKKTAKDRLLELCGLFGKEDQVDV